MGTTVGGAGFSVSVSSAVDFRLEEREGMEGAAVVARRATDAREERVEKALASMVVSVGWKGATVQIRRARAAWDRRGILATLVERGSKENGLRGSGVAAVRGSADGIDTMIPALVAVAEKK